MMAGGPGCERELQGSRRGQAMDLGGLGAQQGNPAAASQPASVAKTRISNWRPQGQTQLLGMFLLVHKVLQK